MKSKIFVTDFDNYEKSIKRIFKALKIKEKIKEDKIIIKPNLTINKKPPTTTDVNCVKEIIKNILNLKIKSKIFIAEGSGGCDTLKAFEDLGYKELEKEFDVKIIDLNRAERVWLKNENAMVLKKIYFPKILLNSFLINVPVPKEHSSAIITNSLKNMFGIYLSKGYIAEWGILKSIGVIVSRNVFSRGWSKADLHVFGVHKSIYDLNIYKKPDLTICDARIGQKGNEINGIACKPKLNKIIASYDAVACDSYIAKIFGYDWKEIEYLRYCNNKIGSAEDYEIIHI